MINNKFKKVITKVFLIMKNNLKQTKKMIYNQKYQKKI